MAQSIDNWKAQEVCNTMYALGRLQFVDNVFLHAAAQHALSSRTWLQGSVVANLNQAAWACGVLGFHHVQFMTQLMHWYGKLLQRHHKFASSKRGSAANGRFIGCAAVMGWSTAQLDMQELAGDIRGLIASSGARRHRNLAPGDAGMFWDTHVWLVQKQLPDQQGLMGVLSQQQLAAGKTASEQHKQGHMS